MATAKTGWERDRRTHFDEVVVKYDNIRPEYPDELYKDIFKFTGTDQNKKALEIGAGTGKATVAFLNAGYDVTAVELGTNMAEFLQKRFKENKNFNVIISAFEDVFLKENTYDLIYAASSFHWVDAEIGCSKAFRLLKSGGVFALFRYNAIPAIGEDVYEEIQTIYEKYYYTYFKENVRPIKKSKDDFNKPSEIFNSFNFEDMKQYGFKNVSMMFYDVTRTFDAEEYLVFLDTLSDHRALPDKNRTALRAGIKEIILKNGGKHIVDYIFQLYMGVRV